MRNSDDSAYGSIKDNEKYEFSEINLLEIWDIDENYETRDKNPHKWRKVYFRANDEIKEKVSHKMITVKKDLKKYKNQLIANVNKVIKSMNRHLNELFLQINQIERKCNKVLENINNSEEILENFTENDIENVLNLNIQQAEHNISLWNVDLYEINLDEINSAIKKTFTFLSPFRKRIKDTIESNELSFFRNGTKNFVTINLDNFETSSIKMPLTEIIHGYTSSCILPDKSYFYFGNYSQNIGATFIIDKDKNIKQLAKSKPNWTLDPIYYDNFVYLIGGQNNYAEKYDLLENKWESLAPIPYGLDFQYGCNILFDNIILMTGCRLQKIVSYRINWDDYRDIPNIDLQEGLFKMMLKGNDRIYVIEKEGRIFESEINDVKKWEVVGDNWINSVNQSSVVKYKDCLYFVTNQDILWRFELSSKRISQVAFT